MSLTKLQHKITIPLPYAAETSLLGVADTLFVEQFYDHEFLAQFEFSFDGTLIQHSDELSGEQDFTSLALPDTLQRPQHPVTHPLDYVGGRWRGLREADRIGSWVQPLTIMEKMPLLQVLAWEIPPPLLLGIAESKVLAEAQLDDETSIVCRRLRLAYALPSPQIDEQGQAYDYDTRLLHIAHTYSADDDSPSLAAVVTGFAGIQLVSPRDCLHYDNNLIIADSQQVVVWTIRDE